MCADKCVGGSGAKLYRCDGAAFDVDSKAKGTRGCQALVGACWQSSTKIGRLHMSLTNIRHALVVPRMQVRELCSPRLPSSLVPNINKKTSSSRDSFKSHSGCGKLSGRSASRLRKVILGTGDKEVATSYIYDAGDLRVCLYVTQVRK